MASYAKGNIIFHWASAAAILLLWPIGKIMAQSDGEPSATLYAVHVVLGLVIAIVTVVRVVWVLRRERPEQLEMSTWERVLYVGNHYALYILLLALSASGIAMLLAAGSFDAVALAKNDGPRDQHEAASTLFLLMFVMHVAGAVSYQVRNGKTLRRMGVPIGD